MSLIKLDKVIINVYALSIGELVDALSGNGVEFYFDESKGKAISQMEKLAKEVNTCNDNLLAVMENAESTINKIIDRFVESDESSASEINLMNKK
jgi:type VII secretion effector (TIGR04197 family)